MQNVKLTKYNSLYALKECILDDEVLHEAFENKESQTLRWAL